MDGLWQDKRLYPLDEYTYSVSFCCSPRPLLALALFVETAGAKLQGSA